MVDNNQSLSYTNGGQRENIRVTIKQVGQNAGTFTYDQPISINTGETILVTLTNWDNLEKSELLIKVSSRGDKETAYYINLTKFSISPTPDTKGQYHTSVTVSLITEQIDKVKLHTFYKIDNGEIQSYTDPFIISDTGIHTIEYWSVNNVGIEEKHTTQTITIIDKESASNTIEPSIINETIIPTPQYSNSDSQNILITPTSNEPRNSDIKDEKK